MNNEFNWWLLIVGLVGGAGLVWLVLTAGRESSEEAQAETRRDEAEWIADRLQKAGAPVDEATAEQILALHRDWETGGAEIDWEWEEASTAGRGDLPAEAGPEDAMESGPENPPPPAASAPRRDATSPDAETSRLTSGPPAE